MVGAVGTEANELPDDRTVVLWTGRDGADLAMSALAREARVEWCEPGDVAFATLALAPDLVVVIGDTDPDGEAIARSLRGQTPGASVPVVTVDDGAPPQPRPRSRFGLVARIEREGSPDAVARHLLTLARSLSRRTPRWKASGDRARFRTLAERFQREGRSGILVIPSVQRGVALSAEGVVPGPDGVAATLDNHGQALEYLLYERPADRLRLIVADRREEALEADLEGARILVVDDEPARARALERTFGQRGAQVRLVPVRASSLSSSKVLDPTLVVVGADALRSGEAHPLWLEPRLSAASLLVVDRDRLPTLGAARLLRAAEQLCQTELELARRLRGGETVIDRLETLGAARWMKVLGRCPRPVRLRVFAAGGQAEVDLEGGKVQRARLEPRDARTAVAEGRAAVDALLPLPFGRVFAGPVGSADAPSAERRIESRPPRVASGPPGAGSPPAHAPRASAGGATTSRPPALFSSSPAASQPPDGSTITSRPPAVSASSPGMSAPPESSTTASRPPALSASSPGTSRPPESSTITSRPPPTRERSPSSDRESTSAAAPGALGGARDAGPPPARAPATLPPAPPVGEPEPPRGPTAISRRAPTAPPSAPPPARAPDRGDGVDDRLESGTLAAPRVASSALGPRPPGPRPPAGGPPSSGIRPRRLKRSRSLLPPDRPLPPVPKGGKVSVPRPSMGRPSGLRVPRPSPAAPDEMTDAVRTRLSSPAPRPDDTPVTPKEDASPLPPPIDFENLARSASIDPGSARDVEGGDEALSDLRSGLKGLDAPRVPTIDGEVDDEGWPIDDDGGPTEVWSRPEDLGSASTEPAPRTRSDIAVPDLGLGLDLDEPDPRGLSLPGPPPSGGWGGLGQPPEAARDVDPDGAATPRRRAETRSDLPGVPSLADQPLPPHPVLSADDLLPDPRPAAPPPTRPTHQGRWWFATGMLVAIAVAVVAVTQLIGARRGDNGAPGADAPSLQVAQEAIAPGAKDELGGRGTDAPAREEPETGGPEEAAPGRPSAPEGSADPTAGEPASATAGEHGAVVDALVEQAREAQARHASREAEALAREALALAPEHPGATYRLAVALVRQRRFEEALDWARRAEDVSPDDPLPVSLQGDIQRTTGHFHQAVRAYERALAISPRFGPAERRLEELRARIAR
ncbi:MAG: tetratricopeptide repeat protein [Sandaracinaceae bacterium]